LLGSVVNEID
jgi:signal transduction histidine kinase